MPPAISSSRTTTGRQWPGKLEEALISAATKPDAAAA
jgi:hypothetical protein